MSFKNLVGNRNFRFVLALGMIAALVLSLVQPTGAVKAAPILTVTPITWNVIGLDSNNVNVGPNNFPVGARVCNTGIEPATNIKADFFWDSSNSLINLRPDSLDPITLDILQGGDCFDFYFEVEVTRSAAAYATSRRYHIGVTADSGISASTPTPREIYVERLVSQNRNGTLDVKLDGVSVAPGGNMTLMVGQTYTITLLARTAVNGYEQIESFINFPNTIFQVLDVVTTYTADTSDNVVNPSDLLYGDGCVWQNDPNSPSYRSCLSTGKTGGIISVVYTVKIIGGSGTSNTLNTLVYDFSGASYHYNSDFSVNGRIVNVMSASLSKSFSPKSLNPGDTSTLTFKINNPSSGSLSGLNFTDQLPEGMTVSSDVISYNGCGTPTPASAAVNDTLLSFSDIEVAGLGTCTISVSVTATGEKLYTNTTTNLFVNDIDTGDNGTDTLLVASTPACLPDQPMAAWTFPTGSSAANPLFTTKAGSVASATASTTTTTPSIDTGYGNPPPSWSGQGFGGSAYFQFQVDTSKYSDVTISLDYRTITQNWNAATVTVFSSIDGLTFTPIGSSPLTATLQSATFNTGAGTTYFRISATGARNNQARMAIDNVTFSGCLTPVPAPTIVKTFSPDLIPVNNPTVLSFTISNTEPGNQNLTGIAFSDALPDGLSVLDSTTSVCNGTDNLIVSASSNTISLTGGALAAGASCSFSVNVIGETPGVHENITGFLSSNESGISSNYAADSLTVIAPPQISKAFGKNFILTTESTTLRFNIFNPNSATTLTGVAFTDTLPAGIDVVSSTSPQCGGTLTLSDNDPLQDTVILNGASLLPGATCTFTIDVTGSSIGLKVNSVTVSSIETGNGNTDEANIIVREASPSLGFLKQVGPALTGPWFSFLSVETGESVFYRFTVENTGDVPLTGISLDDPDINTALCDWIDGDGNALADDDPAADGFTFSLPIADDDEGHMALCMLDPSITAASGSFRNTASVYSNQTSPVTSSATYATPGLSLTKSAAESSFSAVGDTLNYSYDIENNGSVPLAGPVVVTDDKASVTCPDLGTIGDLDNYLDPTESITCLAAYSVTDADVTAGFVTNTATATAGGIASGEAQATVPHQSLADLQIAKTNNTSDNGSIGTPFIWSLTVTNSGEDDAIFPVGQAILADTLPHDATYGIPTVESPSNITGAENISCEINSYNLVCASSGGAVIIGSSTGSFTVSFNVTPTMGGNLENTAAVDPDEIISEIDETNNTGADTVFVAGPGLSVLKEVSDDNSTWTKEILLVGVGETVYYRITVENTGNIALTGILVSDDQCTLSTPSGDANSDGNLDMNETWIYTCSTAAAAGSQTNTVTAAANETPVENDSVEYFGSSASLSITKYVSDDNSTWAESTTVNVGDTVYFRVIVENTGNIPLNGILVNDNQCSLSQPSGDTNVNSILDLDESWVYTCSVPAEAGPHTNTAAASSEEVTEPQEDSADYLGSNASLSITKAADVAFVSSADDVITYQIIVTNTGNVSLTSLTVSDPMLADLDCDQTLEGAQTSGLVLAAGEDLTCTGTYTVTQADIDTNGGGDGQINNLATAADSAEGISETAEEAVEIHQSAMIGAAKRAVSVKKSYPAPLKLHTRFWHAIMVQSPSSVQVTDDLAATFPLPTTFTVLSAASDDFEVNPLLQWQQRHQSA